ncbi:MAG: branched-chain amino acid ABC transporter substrate-binding protein [Caldilineaceae bacterium]|nr:branched-chain amino acid ABC transporter substrate-binding protein [Caldilineaceae bacterium]MDE0337636.1 branched-chain amino acid ABC transporter substrate-binding protein [Caldilineaceae bacterium]
MKTSDTPSPALLSCLALTLTLLLSSACVPQNMVVSPLGTVVVGPGEDIQIRSLEVLTGSIGELGIPRQRALAIALADYGPIKGHNVSMGAGLDSLCTAEGGKAAAETAVGDPRVVGVLGTSCSVAAAAASPILSEAGLVMLSSSNTSPSLTSDLRGNAGANYHPGYYRVSSNDLYQAQAVAEFVHTELGLRRMATIHDGDPYTTGLTAAFAVAFEALGGAVTAVEEVSRGDTDMIPVLTRIAAGNPEGIFFPLFPDEAGHVVQQIEEVEGLAGLALINSESLLFIELESVDAYLAGPEFNFGANVNQATGRSGDELFAAYRQQYNESANNAYIALAYDAATILLRAIEDVAVADGDTLFIDRARLREALTATTGFNGIVGPISCDGFGDCGTGLILISHYTDPAVNDITQLPVVFRYAP